MYNLPAFPFELNLSATSIASFIFWLVTFLVFVISLIMFFHWRKYSLSKKVIILTETVYLSGCFLFILLAFLALN